jgi:hypothetical protein
MAISAAKRKSNQLNAKKSTGPKTVAGKEKVRYNSVTHGGYCKEPVLDWEDPRGFDQRVLGFKTWVQPVGDVENALVEQAALASWHHERAVRSDVARVTFNIHTAMTAERMLKAKEAADLGARLFFDRRGPLSLHPMPGGGDAEVRTSWSNIPDDPDHPARLVRSLESTQAGCRWLIAEWTKLYDRIKAGEGWHSPQKLMAVRLLGKNPIAAAADPEVLAIYLCCHTIDPQHPHAFFEVQCEVTEEEFDRYEQRLLAKKLEAQRPADAVAARAVLLELVDRKLDRLSTLAAERLAFDDAMNALQNDIMGFDDSTAGERLRRHAAGCQRAMHRAIDTIIKIRKNLETPKIDATGSASEEPEIPSIEEPLEPVPPTVTVTDSDEKMFECRSKANEPIDHPQVQATTTVEDRQSATDSAAKPRSRTTDRHVPVSGEFQTAEQGSTEVPERPVPAATDPIQASERRASTDRKPDIPSFTSLKAPATLRELTIAKNALKARALDSPRSARPGGQIPNDRYSAAADSSSPTPSASGWTARRWKLADTRLVKRRSTPR